jgi:hypothetical protein
MSEVQSTPRLSLFQIEAELLQLIDVRDDVLERMSAMSPDQLTASPEIGAELTTVECLIRDYLKAEVRKVDGCAFAIKEFEARAAARSQEAERMKASADRDAETAKRIKAMVLEVMQEFDEKKLPGRLFTITRQVNGGVQPLTISQPDLVPLSCKRVTVSIRGESVSDFARQFGGQYRIVDDLHPDQKDIRETLERGEGVMGARLEDRGEHIRIK